MSKFGFGFLSFKPSFLCSFVGVSCVCGQPIFNSENDHWKMVALVYLDINFIKLDAGNVAGDVVGAS